MPCLFKYTAHFQKALLDLIFQNFDHKLILSSYFFLQFKSTLASTIAGKERSVIFTADLYEIPKERDLYLRDVEYWKETDLEKTGA